MADVGIVGLPNAGKSTLISRVSAVKPKIADYPFSTLTPNLGVVELDMERQFVIADIPGLIQGASDGKGLGNLFLKHIERSRALCFLIDGSLGGPNEWEETLAVLQNELAKHKPELLERPSLIAINKTDAMSPETAAEAKAFSVIGRNGKEALCLSLSAASGDGLKELQNSLYELCRTAQ